MVKKKLEELYLYHQWLYTGNLGQVNYTASKAAISGLVKLLALELSTRNITVNSVALALSVNMTDKLNKVKKMLF